MASISVPNTFTAGTTILSAEVNDNFTTIYNDYNGNITNANLAAGAAIVDTKLAQITTAGKVDGTSLVDLGDIPKQAETTSNCFLIDSDTITTGGLAVFDSNSAETDTRNLVSIVNDNTLATGATILNIQQDANQECIAIAAANTTTDIIDIAAASLTTGTAIDLSDLDAITTGNGIHIDATGTTQTTGILAYLDSAGTGITGAGRLLFSDHTGTTTTSGVLNEFKTAATDETVLMRLNATAALAAGIMMDVTGASITTGTLIDIGDADALTTGKVLNIVSNSSSTSARDLVTIDQTHASASSAIPLKINQDASLALVNFAGSSGADTTSAISTHGTSGATTDHIQIQINGTKAWIAVSTNNPSA